MLAERLAERAAGFDVIDHVDEAVLEGARLHLAFEDFEAAQHGETGVLQRRELAREGHQRLAFDAADGEDFALLVRLLTLLLFVTLLAFGDLFRELGHEIAHLAYFLLRLLLVGRVHLVLDLAPGGVHGLEFEGRHRRAPLTPKGVTSHSPGLVIQPWESKRVNFLP